MRPTQPFRVRLAQTSPRLGDLPTNTADHLELISRAAGADIDLLVFPELSLTGYYLRDLTCDVALTTDAPELAQIAQAAKDLSVVIGIVEESARFSFHTSSLYLQRGRLIHTHRKVYLPTYGMFDEGRYLSPGHSLRAFDTEFGRMGMLVCEDLWHPILPYILAHDGIHYLIVTSNSPSRGAKPEGIGIAQTYDEMLKTYARLFGIYVVFCNRVGYEDGVNFWGGSRVVAPSGDVVACGPLLERAEVDAEIDPLEVRRARAAAPMLEDDDIHLALRELGRIRDERA